MNKVIKVILAIVILFLIENILYTNIYTVYSSWGDDAKSFVDSADPSINITTDRLKKPSSEIYNILTSFGMIAAVVVGVVLGIQYMFSAAEEKAKVLETILPYLIGCIVTFGAFGIWKILINTLYNI